MRLTGFASPSVAPSVCLAPPRQLREAVRNETNRVQTFVRLSSPVVGLPQSRCGMTVDDEDRVPRVRGSGGCGASHRTFSNRSAAQESWSRTSDLRRDDGGARAIPEQVSRPSQMQQAHATALLCRTMHCGSGHAATAASQVARGSERRAGSTRDCLTRLSVLFPLFHPHTRS